MSESRPITTSPFIPARVPAMPPKAPSVAPKPPAISTRPTRTSTPPATIPESNTSKKFSKAILDQTSKKRKHDTAVDSDTKTITNVSHAADEPSAKKTRSNGFSKTLENVQRTKQRTQVLRGTEEKDREHRRTALSEAQSDYIALEPNAIERLPKPNTTEKSSTSNCPKPLEDVSREKQELETKLAESEARHKADLATKDQENINALSALQNEFDALKKEDAEHNLTIKHLHAAIHHKNIAYEEMEKRHKDELTAMAKKFNDDTKKREKVLQKELSEKWKVHLDDEKHRVEDEKRKAAIEAYKLRAEKEEKLLARRNRLLALAREHNSGIQKLQTRKLEGTLHLTKKSEVPSKEDSLSRLTEIWASKGDLIRRILPHELMNDYDFALEFEVETIITARVYMMALEFSDCSPNEFLATGWIITAMTRLSQGLVPYHDGTELSSLSTAIAHICQMLQCAHEVKLAVHVPPTLPSVLANSFGSSTSSQQSSVFDANLAASTASFGSTTSANPAPDQSNNTTGQMSGFGFPAPSSAQPVELFSDVMSVDEPDTVAPQITFQAPANPFGSTLQSGNFSSTNFFQQASLNQCLKAPPAAIQPKPRGACHAMRDTGICARGSSCKWSHNTDDVQRAIAQNAQPSQTQTQTQTRRNPALDTGNDAVAWRSRIQCRNTQDSQVCRKGDCDFFHPPGLHISTSTSSNLPPRGPRSNQQGGDRDRSRSRGRAGPAFNPHQVNQLNRHLQSGQRSAHGSAGQQTGVFGNVDLSLGDRMNIVGGEDVLRGSGRGRGRNRSRGRSHGRGGGQPY